MNREDIIHMAQEAGLYHFYDSEGHCTGITNARLVTEYKERNDDRLVEMLAPFAALVAAAALAEPVQEPLTIERLRDALVASRIIPPAAVEDPDEYDDGITLFRIEALHRRIT